MATTTATTTTEQRQTHSFYTKGFICGNCMRYMLFIICMNASLSLSLFLCRSLHRARIDNSLCCCVSMRRVLRYKEPRAIVYYYIQQPSHLIDRFGYFGADLVDDGDDDDDDDGGSNARSEMIFCG